MFWELNKLNGKRPLMNLITKILKILGLDVFWKKSKKAKTCFWTYWGIEVMEKTFIMAELFKKGWAECDFLEKKKPNIFWEIYWVFGLEKP